MVKIMLPTFAAVRKDVETMFGLLESTVGPSHKIGLEIIGAPKHFQEEESRRQIIENIAAVAKGTYLSVHGFSGLQVYESGIADMRTEAGKCLLLSYLSLADDLNAHYVHVHSGAGYKGNPLAVSTKQEELHKVRQVMLACQNQYQRQIIGVENLPSPSMGDVEKDPANVWRDCVDSLEDCLKVVEGTPLKITFDTCHYACSEQGAIDLASAARKTAPHLHHLHVSDVSGFWAPCSSVWTEGVIPGEGRIGERVFRDFFRYIQERHPDIGICVEVANKDFKNPAESTEAIKRVLSWLK